MYTYIFDDEEFTYTPTDEDLMQACMEYLADDYALTMRAAHDLIADFDIKDRVVEYYSKEFHDYFERDAQLAYKWYKEGLRNA